MLGNVNKLIKLCEKKKGGGEEKVIIFQQVRTVPIQ